MNKNIAQNNGRKDCFEESNFALIPITGEIPKLKCGLLKVYASLISHSFVADGKRISRATNADIAQHIGTNPRSVTRAVSSLGKLGLLQVDQTGVIRTITLKEVDSSKWVKIRFDDPVWSVSDNAFQVWVGLRFHKGRNHSCYPTDARLIQFLGVSKRRIQEGVQALKKTGFIDTEARKHGGKWFRVVYFPALESDPRQNQHKKDMQESDPRQNRHKKDMQGNRSNFFSGNLDKNGTDPRQNQHTPLDKTSTPPLTKPAQEKRILKRNFEKETNTHTRATREGQVGVVCNDFSISSTGSNQEPKQEPENQSIDQQRIDDTMSRFKKLAKDKQFNKQSMIEVLRALKPKLEKELIPLEFLDNCFDEINKETLYPVKIFLRNLSRWDTYDQSEKAIFKDKSSHEVFMDSLISDARPDKTKNTKPPESGFNGASRDSREVVAERDGYQQISIDFEEKLKQLPKIFLEEIYEKEYAKEVNGKTWAKNEKCQWFIDRHAKGLPLPEKENFEPSGPVDQAGQIANELEAVKARTLEIKANIQRKNKAIELEAEKLVQAELRSEQSRIDIQCRGDMKKLEKALDSLRLMEETRLKEATRRAKERYRPAIEVLEKEMDQMIAERTRLETELSRASDQTAKVESHYTDEKKENSAVNDSAKIVAQLLKDNGVNQIA